MAISGNDGRAPANVPTEAPSQTHRQAENFGSPSNAPAGDDPVRAAEDAVAQLRDQFTDWAKADIERLKRAVEAVVPQRADAAAIDQIYAFAHDLKGLGGSFGYSLLSDIADSLCRLTKGLNVATPAQRVLMSAHADSMSLILQEGAAGITQDRPRRMVQLLADLVKSECG